MMQFHRGRLVDHVHIVVADLTASLAFYKAILGSLGLDIQRETEHFFTTDELFVSPVRPGQALSHIHLAFQTDGPAQVAAFHAAGLAAGGRDNGGPGERPYHPGYYAAFLLDPDGNNIEAVFHGPSDRSAPAVIVNPK